MDKTDCFRIESITILSGSSHVPICEEAKIPFPGAADALENDFCMDDYAAGAETVVEAVQFAK